MIWPPNRCSNMAPASAFGGSCGCSRNAGSPPPSSPAPKLWSVTRQRRKAIRAAGFDICCRRLKWVNHFELTEAEERDHVRRPSPSLTTTTGSPPIGGIADRASVNTALVETGGFLPDSDAYNDDLPYWTRVAGRTLVVPCSLVNNDSKFSRGWLGHGEDYFQFMRDGFDFLHAEGRAAADDVLRPAFAADRPSGAGHGPAAFPRSRCRYAGGVGHRPISPIGRPPSARRQNSKGGAMPASETPALSIVDAQIHLWGTGLPWPPGHRQVTAFTAGEAIALMDAGIDHGDPPARLGSGIDGWPGARVGRFAIIGSLPLEKFGGGGGHRHLARPAGHARAAFLAAR